MRLRKIRVQNYRNALDTGWVSIEQVTCLVGKNEAGKTACLKALEGLRSTDSTFTQYDKTQNYPRKYLAEYDQTHKWQAAQVIETQWELDEIDVEAIEEEFGENVLTKNTVSISKRYDGSSSWNISLDEQKVLSLLINKLDLTTGDAQCINEISTTRSAAKKLEELQNSNEKQKKLLTAIKKFPDCSCRLHGIDVLKQHVPKFLYFSHYDRMSGEISINQLNADKNTNKIKVGDQVFLDFLEYAGTTLDELSTTNKFEELKAKCEAAANRITDQIFDYWTQNDNLEIDIVLSEGKTGDPPPFHAGLVARARVKNNLHRVTVPFSERSAGFIWFFSFLVKFAHIKKNHGNVIILLDEPGLTLHGTAQKDLLRYFEKEIATRHQLIYTTHSPFMVPADNLLSVRTVEDVVTQDKRGRKTSKGTKIRDDILAIDPQTNFPIYGALGFEVAQTLLIGENTLLVEGPSDILYIQAASAALSKKGRTGLSPAWTICPSGGIDKIIPFVRLFFGNKLNIAVLTDFDKGQKRKLEALRNSEILEHERIILATDIANKQEADIEDFFEPQLFVDLLNTTYNLKGEHRLTTHKLENANKGTERLVKKAEAYFRILPPSYAEFNHYDPSTYLHQNPKILEKNAAKVTKTLDRFEQAFQRINSFLNK